VRSACSPYGAQARQGIMHIDKIQVVKWRKKEFAKDANQNKYETNSLHDVKYVGFKRNLTVCRKDLGQIIVPSFILIK
jgi:hypothetical protein